MPVTTRRARKGNPKVKGTFSAEAQKLSDSDEISQSPTPGDQAASPTASVLQTIETSATIPDGHCIIRKLEDGRYEILNFSSADASVFGSMETGHLIRADETGGRLKALEMAHNSWKDTELKFGQILGSANQRIFRLLKLPLELRLSIYDLTVCSEKKLRIGSWEYNSIQILPGIQLRGTCKQVYEETKSMFWRNHFRITDICKKAKLLLPCLTENLREVSWAWWGLKIKDPGTLRMFQSCKNLRILHLNINKYSITSDDDIRPGRLQYLHQQEPAATKFRQTSGFDELMRIRGLETVTVRQDSRTDIKIAPEDLSAAELKAFEDFLSKILTQPREPEIIKTIAKTKKVGNKGSKGLVK